MPENGAELLARIRPSLREESTWLCLRPDLLDAREAAELELEDRATADVKGKRLADKPDPEIAVLAARVQEIEAEIEATQVKVTLRAMNKDAWNALLADHPPRKGNELDAYAGYNRDAVIDEAVRLCMIDPVFDAESWPDFTAVLNPSEWQELRRLAQSVNRAVTDSPKSVLASRILARAGSD